ncbi:hypothetical protein MYCTH_2307514 [Thermothelomyces thermophilus ATCC 42464]|uniref:Uncharacterized protein n=1 Tax=Thermothelomyces thermophilus (strain ATCC 42464 / BCRC 31852 / DSM 1799) TaxID=573729 RepID=G2QFZ8_THET4|nr:uncharacterized protein MYCTH_2307514 [Thermothelomyces thermophilus ATCC 42464]AEO59311.1 hypothetical protein MYCTH_2307514 [Thermothelomyces thermophilus ATCC 42464]
MRFLAFHFLLLLGGIRRVSGLALIWGRQHHSNATSSFDKRQQTVLVTKLSTIYYSGDSSKPRTAEPGFDIRIDLLHGLFGFCPTTVIAATDCGLGGACIDSFACSKGCGLTGDPVTTWTW